MTSVFNKNILKFYINGKSLTFLNSYCKITIFNLIRYAAFPDKFPVESQQYFLFLCMKLLNELLEFCIHEVIIRHKKPLISIFS